MHPKLKLALLFIFITVCKAYPQNSFPQQVHYQLNQYLLGNIQEKLYVQTNSSQYLPGDTIWVKASLVNAINHKPIGIENLIYVDLISPENKLVAHQLFALESGFSDGFLALDHKLMSGQYKLLAYTNYMRNFDSDFLFQKLLTVASGTADQTKWEFNSKIITYAKGDSVSVKMYAHTRNGRELNEDINVHLQLARGTMLGAVCPITNNTGSFSFFVPDSLKPPVAILSVKQNGESSIGEKYRIKLSPPQPDLRFLPEGGELVAGQENQLAFRCVDADGNPLNVSGQLLAANGKAITGFSTEYDGMGSLKITPQARQKYSAKISYRDSVFTYDLPGINDEAYSIHLLTQDADSIHFALLKSGNTTPYFLLLGHCRGNTKFMVTGVLENHRLELSVPTEDFPEGILSFTLFINRIPRAERLVYLDKEENIRFKLVKAWTDDTNTTADFSLQAFRKDGSPVNCNFSLTGWNSKLENSLDSLENIHNYLQFSSDLQGEVLANTAVFNPTDPTQNARRDLLLMTYGWRRFNWVDIASFGSEQLAYKPEKGLYLNGRIYRKLTGKPVPKNFEVSIILKLKKSIDIDKTYTKENGQFNFSLPAFTDSASLTIQTKNRSDRQKDYIIDLNTNLEQMHLNAMSFDKIDKSGSSPLVLNFPPTQQISGVETSSTTTAEVPKPAVIKKPRIDNYYFPGKDTFLIEEVEARSNFLNRRDSMIAQTGQPDVVIESAQLKQLTEEKAWYANLWDLLADQVPGLRITQAPYQARLAKNCNLVIANPSDVASLSGDTFEIGSPAVYFNVSENPDGYLYIFVDRDFLNSESVPLYDFLSYMDPGEIESLNFIARPKNYDVSMSFMDVFTTLSLELGRQDLVEGLETGGNLFPNQMEFMETTQRTTAPPAFLFITTKSKGGIFYQRSKGLQSLFLTGITAPREFYIPKYKASDDGLASQFRKTVFWEPQLVTDTNGVAQIAIPSAVVNANTIFQIQGISAQGESGSQTFTFNPNQKQENRMTAAPAIAATTATSANQTNDYAKLRMYTGVVTDAETGNPISFADLSQSSLYYHECTNSAGGFFLSADRLKGYQEITVSSPGYQPQKLPVPANISAVIQIKLVKAPISKPDEPSKARSVVRNAIRESRQLYASEESFHGYNRETVAIDGNVYGIYEMAFNYSNAGSPGIPSAIRFETAKFKNTEDKNGHKLMMLKPNHRSLFYPLIADVLATAPEFWRLETTDRFDYDEVGQVEYDGELCYKIQFKQNDQLVLALQSGMLYIGKQSGALRYATWNTTPDKRKYVSYTSYLQSNPMEYDVQLTDDYNEASYSLQNGQLRLQGTSRQLTVLVNGQDYLQFNNRLSIVGKSPRSYKDLTNKNTDLLIEDQQSKHMMVKDASYQIEPWVNLGIVKPEQKLLKDAEYLHDISLYR
ncbi:peptidase associated/transthyretin-like domain-containing protein [Mangrovibacterium lignilyticum]|uniref:hypothetical protein n=1 Tax=Mangrovibacterium lignilyticum TaxID=2668052 RepID=UPI0013D6CBA4|nr:hypothetical protein [Mangrovibacterium lignilyticum]